jgi:hypothetical protein
MLIQHVCKSIENEYGEYIIFEHGPIQERSLVGCGVDHAHIHIVPVNLMLPQINEFCDFSVQWDKVDSIHSASIYTDENKAYLYFQDSNRNSYIGTSEKIPSQFFRRIIAKMIGKPEMFDWKNYFFLDNIANTYTRLDKYSKINKLSKLATYA